MDSGQNPVETRKSEIQGVILVGESSMKILYPSPLCQTLSKDSSTSRKVETTMFSHVETFHNGLGKPEEISSVDLFCLELD